VGMTNVKRLLLHYTSIRQEVGRACTPQCIPVAYAPESQRRGARRAWQSGPEGRSECGSDRVAPGLRAIMRGKQIGGLSGVGICSADLRW